MKNLPLQLEEKQREVVKDLTGRLPILLEVAAVVLRQVALQMTSATKKPVVAARAGFALPPEAVENASADEGSSYRGECTEDWMRSFYNPFLEVRRLCQALSTLTISSGLRTDPPLETVKITQKRVELQS